MYTMGHKSHHTLALDDLVTHLQKIDEYPDNIEWIMREGIWTPHRNTSYSVFPDLILVYKDKHAIPVELKSVGYSGKHHLEQLRAGRDFILNQLQLDCDYSKISRYDTRKPYLVNEFKTIQW